MGTQKLQKARIRVYRALGICFSLSACSSMPTPDFTEFSFPSADAFIGNSTRPYVVLGLVRSKVNYQSLDPGHEEETLCRNYYNKSVQDLVKMARKKGGNAVLDVKSVVFLEDGQHEFYTAPECSDDGFEGQVLTQGIAVKWK